MPKLSSGQASWAAMITPTSMPTTPHTTAINENCRTTVSWYVAAGCF
jgi:hypothetical protein